jgi:hypothetical protein
LRIFNPTLVKDGLSTGMDLTMATPPALLKVKTILSELWLVREMETEHITDDQAEPEGMSVDSLPSLRSLG